MERIQEAIPSWVHKLPLRPMFSLGLLYLAKQFDFEDTNNLLILRVVNLACVIVAVLTWVFIMYRASYAADAERLIKCNQSDMNQQDQEKPDVDDKIKVSVKDYDHHQVRTKLTELTVQTVISSIMHSYFGYTIPLVMQCSSVLLSVLEHNLFKIYVLGFDPKMKLELRRPWKASKGQFQELMQRSVRDANALVDTLDGTSSTTRVNSDKATKRKGKKGKTR